MTKTKTKTRYYRIKAFTPTDIFYEEYVAVAGPTDRFCLEQAQEMAANFSNNIANFEFNNVKTDNTPRTLEEYLGECGWAVHPISRARYKELTERN